MAEGTFSGNLVCCILHLTLFFLCFVFRFFLSDMDNNCRRRSDSVLVSCIVLIMMRNKTPNRAVDAGVPLSSLSHAAHPAASQHPHSPHIRPLSQPAENPYSPHPLGYAPALTNLSLADAENHYPPESSPSYTGVGTALQDQPPGHHTHGYSVHQ